ncbi:MAG TPA: M20 family metallopeptidase, partial [Deltaproteobacteria bacterium]|nr:M20 family metallopeptidase [Deltaproteobacteria bacterium]
MIPYAVIEAESECLSEEAIRLRRDFHAHPELGFQEHRTAGIIARYCAGLGLEVKTGVARTGVTALLRGALPGRTVMLRADMDALPIQELTDADYRSTTPGVMHACGHDGHMAILLGTASLLAAHRHALRGNVLFVFQPAEENLGGARLMIEEGVLGNPAVDAAFGLHLISILPRGYIGTCRGPFMAAMDTFTIRVRGRSGHSAMPDGSVDAISLSARIIAGLGEGVRQGLPPGSRHLVNIGMVRGGSAPNIVADLVEMEGTVRCLDEQDHPKIPELMDGFLRKTAQACGGSCELIYEHGYPLTVNDPAMTEIVMAAGSLVVGADHVMDLPPSMASEDM